MNERRFLKQLEKNARNKMITHGYVQELFAAKKSFFNDQKIDYLIEKHFDSFIKGIPSGYLSLVIEALYNQASLRSFLIQENTLKSIIEISEDYEFGDLIINNVMKDKFNNYIENNFDEFLETLSLKKMVYIHNKMTLNSQNKEKLNLYFKEHKDEFLNELLTTTLSFNEDCDMKSYESLRKVMAELVDRILNKENCELVDVQELFHGGFSSVIRIGDTILKVGKSRQTFDIPNDERILQPLLRRDLSSELGIPVVIEVSDRVDTQISLSHEELYNIYKEMRDRGIVCGDFKHSNIGRLLKDNVGRNNDNNGLHGEVGRVLKKGEYVILDTDFIYHEDSSDVVLTSNESIVYEKRYRKESQKNENDVKEECERKERENTLLTSRK